MKRALLLTIRLYQRLLSPLLLPACRYVPTCSQYAHEAVELHGSAKGAMLAAWRLLRCHPLARGGFDPVPHNNCDPVLHANSEGHGFSRAVHPLARGGFDSVAHNNCDPVLHTNSEGHGFSPAVHPHSHIRALAPEAKEII